MTFVTAKLDCNSASTQPANSKGKNGSTKEAYLSKRFLRLRDNLPLIMEESIGCRTRIKSHQALTSYFCFYTMERSKKL